MVLVVKNPLANAGDLRDTGSIPGLGRLPGLSHGNPLQYSCLENSMNRGAWWVTVHRVTKSQTRLSNYHFHFQMLSWTSEVALLVKNPPANARDTRDSSSIPRSGRSPGGGHGNPLHSSCLENSMNRGAW